METNTKMTLLVRVNTEPEIYVRRLNFAIYEHLNA